MTATNSVMSIVDSFSGANRLDHLTQTTKPMTAKDNVLFTKFQVSTDNKEWFI